jgi:hypothetical protein
MSLVHIGVRDRDGKIFEEGKYEHESFLVIHIVGSLRHVNVVLRPVERRFLWISRSMSVVA